MKENTNSHNKKLRVGDTVRIKKIDGHLVECERVVKQVFFDSSFKIDLPIYVPFNEVSVGIKYRIVDVVFIGFPDYDDFEIIEKKKGRD